MKKQFALVALPLLCVSAPCLAQDADYGEPQNSAGAHIAIVTGYDNNNFAGTTAPDILNGVSYGVKLGYDFSVTEHGLLGVEVETTNSTAKLDFGGGDAIKMGRDLYIGGRLKFDVSEAVALYLKGGYTNAEIKATSAGLVAKVDIDGWRLGAGAEFKLTSKLFGLVEYRYSNYGTTDDGLGTRVKFDRHQGIAGLGYRF